MGVNADGRRELLGLNEVFTGLDWGRRFTTLPVTGAEVVDILGEPFFHAPQAYWLISLTEAARRRGVSALLDGDDRSLYLGWLLGVQVGEVEDEDIEPPVPPGLGALDEPAITCGRHLPAECRCR